jgi:hypothetical protein
MPVRSHHTAPSASTQSPASTADTWNSEVVARLPAHFDAQARKLKAFQRKRSFDCPSDLLRGIIVFALCPFGFRWLGAWGVLSDVADISAPAWHDALLRSSAWLLWLIGQLLVANDRPTWITQRVRGRVWVVDASMLGQVGRPGDAWRLHLAFDLIAGQVGQVHLTNRHSGERLSHFELEVGDLVLLDAGYGYRSTLATAQSHGADVLVPFTPSTCPLSNGQGRALDVVAWLERDGPPLRSRNAYWTHDGQAGRVRIVAKRLTAVARQAAERRLERNAQKHGRAVSQVARLLCGWHLLLTSLAAESWSDEEVVWLYRARWQVELLFKRMKQMIKLGRLRSTSEEGATATIRALLVAWLLQEQVGRELQALLPQAKQPAAAQAVQERSREVVSRWRLAVLSLETVRQQAQGSWSEERVRACLPRLQRFLVSRASRAHQETEVRDFLLGRMSGRQLGQ